MIQAVQLLLWWCQWIDDVSCFAPGSRMTGANPEKGPVIEVWKPLGRSSSVAAMGLSWLQFWLDPCICSCSRLTCQMETGHSIWGDCREGSRESHRKTEKGTGSQGQRSSWAGSEIACSGYFLARISSLSDSFAWLTSWKGSFRRLSKKCVPSSHRKSKRLKKHGGRCKAVSRMFVRNDCGVNRTVSNQLWHVHAFGVGRVNNFYFWKAFRPDLRSSFHWFFQGRDPQIWYWYNGVTGQCVLWSVLVLESWSSVATANTLFPWLKDDSCCSALYFSTVMFEQMYVKLKILISRF